MRPSNTLPTLAKLSLIVLATVLTCAGCGSPRPEIRPGATSDDTIAVMPVKNLAGVPLKFPEVYFGDNLGTGDGLEAKSLELAELARAGLLSRVRTLGYRADVEGTSTSSRYELHAAVTHFDAAELRATGRFSISMTMMLVEAASRKVAASSETNREFQLFDVAPDESGAIGAQRFVESRIKMFMESLSWALVDDSGL